MMRWIGLTMLIVLGGCGSDNTKVPNKIGVLPKLINVGYFNAAQQGTVQAGASLNVTVDFNGPLDTDVNKQIDQINTWVAAKYDAIAVSCDGPETATALKAAIAAGVKVVTWDSDTDASQPTARNFFINQATIDGVGKGLIDTLESAIGDHGKYIIITASATAANQNAWIAAMNTYQQATYPNMMNLTPGGPGTATGPLVTNDDPDTGVAVATNALSGRFPTMQGIISPTTVGIKTAAQVMSQMHTTGIYLTGLGLPNEMKPYVADGTVSKFLLWNPIDLGYLTVYAANGLVDGDLTAGATSFTAGRLSSVTVSGDEILLGPPFVFDASNIGDFNF